MECSNKTRNCEVWKKNHWRIFARLRNMFVRYTGIYLELNIPNLNIIYEEIPLSNIFSLVSWKFICKEHSIVTIKKVYIVSSLQCHHQHFQSIMNTFFYMFSLLTNQLTPYKTLPPTELWLAGRILSLRPVLSPKYNRIRLQPYASNNTKLNVDLHPELRHLSPKSYISINLQKSVNRRESTVSEIESEYPSKNLYMYAWCVRDNTIINI